MPGTRQEVTPSTAVILERGGSFFVYEPEIGIVASDVTAEGAYRKFAQAKHALMEDAGRAGLMAKQYVRSPQAQQKPRHSVGQRSVAAELTMFLAKVCIFFLVVGVIGGLAASNIKPLAIADIADKAADIARDISSLSPEKKELLRQSVGTVSRELSPVVDAWRNPPRQ
jgi:hypothetical protein